MKYYEITIETAADRLEELADALAEQGVGSVELIDPETVRGMLQNTGPTEYANASEFQDALGSVPAVKFYLPCGESVDAPSGACCLADAPDVGRLIEALAEAAPGVFLCENVRISIVDDSDWKDKWKEYYVPARLTERIWVAPGWTDFGPEDAGSDDAVIIKIDPGMAFGTGTHETTFLALRLMEKYLKPGDSVLDVGCGTGILAIAAAKLGAGRALGIDIDPEAVRASAENAAVNGVSDRVEIVEGDLLSGDSSALAGFKADVAVANLLTPLVILLTPAVPEHLKPGGIFISSGILDEHVPSVTEELAKHGFRVAEVLSEGGWSSVAAKM